MLLASGDGYGLGMGVGLVLSSLATRLMFAPFIIYGQTVGHKMKLLQPDLDVIQSAMKRYGQQGNREAAKIEQAKIKRIRKTHGIYPLFSLVNIMQFPIHMVYISMINQIAYNYTINPAILTEGMLWFTDLSSPDPFGILPVTAGLINLMNIMSTSTANSSVTMRKMRRLMYFLPVISIPIQMTFPCAFNLYWITTSFVQLSILNAFRFDGFRRFVGIPRYLPGSQLEKLNATATHIVDKPATFSAPPSGTRQKK